MLRAGVARAAITPPIGVELAGWAFGPSVGVLDDLEAQALVLDDGSGPVAIVTADLLGLGEGLVQAVRERAEAKLGISGGRILLSASHTHSGPATAFYRHWGEMDESYLRFVEAALFGLVAAAQHNLQEATIRLGMGSVHGVSRNRRSPEHPIDPGVPVLRIDDAAGQPMVVLWGFSCHPVSLHSYRNLISPDYPGYARSAIRAVLGQDVTVMFALGSGGDVNPASFVWKQTGPAQSQQMGTILGCEVAKVALGAAPCPAPAIRVSQAVVNVPLAPLPTAEDLRTARDQAAAEAARLRSAGQSWEAIANAEIKHDWADEALQALAAGKVPATRPCELQSIRVGDAALVAMPFEVFTETGLAIRAASPAQVTLVSANSNGAVAYLPLREAFDVEDYTNPQGLAPKVYGLYALAEGAEPLVRQAAIDLVRMLFTGEKT